MHRERRLPALVLVLATWLSPMSLLSCGPKERHAEDDHGAEERPVRLLDPAELLKRLCDPATLGRVSRVQLRGQLDPSDDAPRRPVEERASWPSGWQRRTAEAGLAFEVGLEGDLLRVTPERPGRGPGLQVSAARMRRRALFVLKHLAEAVEAGEKAEIVERFGERLQALRARDADGGFLILLGGVAGGLRGVEDGDEAVLFQAHAAFGRWFYPSVQSAARKGRILEVLRVTRLEAN